MSIRRLLEDLDALEMDDDIAIDDDFGIIPEIEECVLAYDDEGNLVSEHISANEFLVEFGISQDELEALIKESGEPLRLFKVVPEGADDYGLYIGNEACTAEDVKNRLISNLGDDAEDLEVSEIKPEEEPEEKNEPDAEIPTEEQLKEGWHDENGYVYYCISDGMNPRKSIIIPDGEGARERAIAHAEANKPKYKYVSMFKDGDEKVIWELDEDCALNEGDVRPTNRQKKIGNDSGWGEFEVEHGYGIFQEGNPKHPLEVICRIDDMDVFDGDLEAVEQAKKDGYKFLELGKEFDTDMIDVLPQQVLDTEENRKNLEFYTRDSDDDDDYKKQTEGKLKEDYFDFRNFLNNITVNAPKYRGASMPRLNPDLINEPSIPDNMRFKDYEVSVDYDAEGNAGILKWTTQGEFNDSDFEELIKEVDRCVKHLIKKTGFNEPFALNVIADCRDGSQHGHGERKLAFNSSEAKANLADGKLKEAKEGPSNIFGYINGDLNGFDPADLVAKVKERKQSLHTNRMVKDTDDVKVCHHIVVDTLGWTDEPHVWVDVVEDTWTRNPGDPDDINSYYGTNAQERILMKDCGKGDAGFEKAIAELEKYKADALAKYGNIGEECKEACDLEESKLPYHVLAWRLNEIISSMDNEEAYYGGWLYIWPDGETKEDCRSDFANKEDYEDLLDAFKRYYKAYHKDGLYTDDKRILGYAREMDKKLGLEPIKNHGKAQLDEGIEKGKFSKQDSEAIAKWWKDVEALGKYKIDNGDYSDIEALHSAMFDMLSDLSKEEGKEEKRLFAKGKRLYNRHALSQYK